MEKVMNKHQTATDVYTVLCSFKFESMKVDKNKVIISKPRMLCSSCFKESCEGECWWTIKFYRWFKKLIN